MFCISCGTHLPDEANFCWKCGKPQKPGIQPNKPKWETCEIVSEKVRDGGVFSGDYLRFWAEAIGSDGQYSAGESAVFKGPYIVGYPSFPNSDDQNTTVAHKTLIQKLVKDGWEPASDRGLNWWNYRFRRRVK